jgi:hypothetical protein
MTPFTGWDFLSADQGHSAPPAPPPPRPSPAAAPAPAEQSALPLERYLDLFQLLTKGSGVVQALSSLEQGALRAADVKGVLLVAGCLPGGGAKADVLSRMVGLRLPIPLVLGRRGSTGQVGGGPASRPPVHPLPWPGQARGAGAEPGPAKARSMRYCLCAQEDGAPPEAGDAADGPSPGTLGALGWLQSMPQSVLQQAADALGRPSGRHSQLPEPPAPAAAQQAIPGAAEIPVAPSQAPLAPPPAAVQQPSPSSSPLPAVETEPPPPPAASAEPAPSPVDSNETRASTEEGARYATVRVLESDSQAAAEVEQPVAWLREGVRRLAQWSQGCSEALHHPEGLVGRKARMWGGGVHPAALQLCSPPAELAGRPPALAGSAIQGAVRGLQAGAKLHPRLPASPDKAAAPRQQEAPTCAGGLCPSGGVPCPGGWGGRRGALGPARGPVSRGLPPGKGRACLWVLCAGGGTVCGGYCARGVLCAGDAVRGGYCVQEVLCAGGTGRGAGSTQGSPGWACAGRAHPPTRPPTRPPTATHARTPALTRPCPAPMQGARVCWGRARAR